jgi:hypothetical protein
MSADAKEAAFQLNIVGQMVTGSCQLGHASQYNRKLALSGPEVLR